MLKTVDKKLTTYDFEMINCKTKKRSFTIYDLLKKNDNPPRRINKV